MLHFIDVSNWQKGLTLPEGKIDACIVKATEGTTFVDRYCDGFIQQCKRKGLLYGFYHFATSAEPEEQASFFAEHTQGYSLEGIPVLDIESDRIEDWGAFAQRFVDKYHAITTVWPWIYCSAGYLARFAGYPLISTCGLWVAGYPDNKIRGIKDVPDFRYKVSPWKFAAAWQYTSNGAVDFWDEPVDLDVAWMDATAWHKYANPIGSVEHTQQLEVPGPSPDPQVPTWTLENGHVRVDITLKGKEV